MDLSDKIEKLLTRVNKPASYMGGELYSVIKAPEDVELHFGFCFPDLYEIGMSYLGMQIIYHVLNEQPWIWCQRLFAPGADMEALMRSEDVPLFTIEKKQPAREMDILGFTLQYELSFTNIINMLDLAGIPALSSERDDTMPIIAAGGNCSFSPEPLADVFDFFMLGDGEDVLIEVSEAVLRYKKELARLKETQVGSQMEPAEYAKPGRKNYIENMPAGRSASGPKERLLRELAGIDGVYVPSFYEPQYAEDGKMTGHRRLWEGAPELVVKRFIMDMDEVAYPLHPIVPFTDTVHDRSVIELFRGCTRGCRFCQAGMICRPVRERSPEIVREYARQSLKNTGYDEMSLLSLSTSDYSRIEPLVRDLMQGCRAMDVGLSLPSLRLDSFSEEILREIMGVRKTGLTFAPEAGTQRLRDIINKSITEEQIFTAVEKAIRLGYNNIKLYFMIGLPGESDEDLDGIAEIARRIVAINREISEKKGRFNVTVSVSNFVPKAQTPFQWAAQDTPEEFNRKHLYLKDRLKKLKQVSYQYHGTETSFLEAVFARGDRRVGRALIRAWELGCRFDGWTEHFDYAKWLQAFEETGVDPDFYAHRERGEDEYLPWYLIDCGVSREYMLKEKHRAEAGIQTRDCRKGCTGCGIKRYEECPVYEQGANYS